MDCLKGEKTKEKVLLQENYYRIISLFFYHFIFHLKLLRVDFILTLLLVNSLLSGLKKMAIDALAYFTGFRVFFVFCFFFK